MDEEPIPPDTDDSFDDLGAELGENMAEPLAVHSWSIAAGFNDALFIDVGPKRPKEAAAFAVNRLAARAPADRTIRFWDAFPDMAGGDHVKQLLNGVDTHAHYAFYREFFQRLAAAKIVPSYLMFDHESLLLTWTWSQLNTLTSADARQAVIADAITKLRAAGKLPSYLNGVQAADFNHFDAAGIRSIGLWNRYTLDQSYKALRASVVEPCRRAFGRVLPMSNYNDTRLSFPVFDYNGWEATSDTCQALTTFSSPSLYIGGGGNRYLGRAKIVSWNSFIDDLNFARSCLARGPDFAPWVSCPSTGGPKGEKVGAKRWLWRQLMLHLRATGTQRYLYWNPTNPNIITDNAYARTVFNEAATQKGTRQELHALDLDINSVTTGIITTTYAQYEAERRK